MQLHHEGHLAIGEPVRHGQVPQRAIAAQGRRRDGGHQAVELPLAPGSRQSHMVHVLGEIEVGVVDDERVAQIVGDHDHAATQDGHPVEAGSEQLEQHRRSEQVGAP